MQVHIKTDQKFYVFYFYFIFPIHLGSWCFSRLVNLLWNFRDMQEITLLKGGQEMKIVTYSLRTRYKEYILPLKSSRIQISAAGRKSFKLKIKSDGQCFSIPPMVTKGIRSKKLLSKVLLEIQSNFSLKVFDAIKP